jgi:sporulation protein YlmC with PRC-barrel domain
MDQHTRNASDAAATTRVGDLEGSAGAERDSGGARIAGSAHLGDDSGPGPEVMAASAFEGETVMNHQGETLGEIEEIMLDVAGGRIAYAVLAVGGFLGIGEKYFAIPWSALTLDTDRKCFLLYIDKERLRNAPGFDNEHWPTVRDVEWPSDTTA